MSLLWAFCEFATLTVSSQLLYHCMVSSSGDLTNNSQQAHGMSCNSRRAHSKLTVWAHLVSWPWGRWVTSKWTCCELPCELMASNSSLDIAKFRLIVIDDSGLWAKVKVISFHLFIILPLFFSLQALHQFATFFHQIGKSSTKKEKKNRSMDRTTSCICHHKRPI